MGVVEGLTEGRIVHFVLPNGEHRAAIVVKVLNKNSGMVNLQVFLDGTNDRSAVAAIDGGIQLDMGTLWKASVPHSEDKGSGSWHWTEKA